MTKLFGPSQRQQQQPTSDAEVDRNLDVETTVYFGCCAAGASAASPEFGRTDGGVDTNSSYGRDVNIFVCSRRCLFLKLWSGGQRTWNAGEYLGDYCRSPSGGPFGAFNFDANGPL